MQRDFLEARQLALGAGDWGLNIGLRCSLITDLVAGSRTNDRWDHGNREDQRTFLSGH
jgi:hypothetical protein